MLFWKSIESEPLAHGKCFIYTINTLILKAAQFHMIGKQREWEDKYKREEWWTRGERAREGDSDPKHVRKRKKNRHK